MGTTTDIKEVTDKEFDDLYSAITKIKEDIGDRKIIISHYPIKSNKLKELQKAQKGINEQIKEEKERIETEHYENEDYENAKNETLTLKEKLLEKLTQLRLAYRHKFRSPEMQSEDRQVNGERVSLICEFVPKIYANGKELK